MPSPTVCLPSLRMQAAFYVFIFAIFFGSALVATAREADFTNVEFTASPGVFPIVQNAAAATIFVDSQDWPGVVRAAGDLKADINSVTKIEPKIVNDRQSLGSTTIIVGTLGKSSLVDQLVHDQKIDVGRIKDKWESYLLETVENPLPGVKSALVIVGSDKRGTIYGIYDLSRQIGVSPWYFWADVPVPHHDALFLKAGRYVEGPPAVKYRGIFLNDEAPALSGWVRENYKTYNHEFYAKVFELFLRLRQLSLARDVGQLFR